MSEETKDNPLPASFTRGELLYENPLASESDLTEFVSEGSPILSFPMGRMRLENGLSADQGQAANYLFWLRRKFPSDLILRWEFQPIREPGLAMIWFGSNGRNGKDLFDATLPPRNGNYKQYHSGEINGYHASYFRRKQADERAFHTCNLRKSHGFHLVCQGGDPIPNAEDVAAPFPIEVQKCGGTIRFFIRNLLIFEWIDDGETYGPILGEGYIGFRQMAPLIAEYSQLRVWKAEKQ